MTYMSRVKLDTALRETRSALASPQRMHAIVASCFDGVMERQRPLWRIDTLNDSIYLMIVSSVHPDFTNIASQITSQVDAEMLTKDYDRFLASISEGDNLRFRLTANPVHSVTSESSGSTRSKVYGHVTVEHQKEWLKQRSEKNGFTLLSFDVVSRGERNFKRQQATITLTIATYEGLIRISDADMLRRTLIYGIGRAKAYGCGLMTVARYEQ